MDVGGERTAVSYGVAPGSLVVATAQVPPGCPLGSTENMTLDEIDARDRAAVLTVGSGDAEWDDPETAAEKDADDGELGYRDADEDATYDETGGEQEDQA